MSAVTQWFYAVSGVQYGPVSEEDLRGFVREGRIGADDLVWNPGMPQWAQARSALSEIGTPFFGIGVWKLNLMVFGTFGAYELYWMYKQWNAIRTRTGEDMWPIARAIFPIFFFHKLLGEVNDVERAGAGSKRLPTSGLAALFIITSLCWRLPDPFWLISMLALIPVAITQKRMNELNAQAAPLADPNRRMRGWNWLAMILGLPLFAFAVWLTFFPE